MMRLIDKLQEEYEREQLAKGKPRELHRRAGPVEESLCALRRAERKYGKNPTRTAQIKALEKHSDGVPEEHYADSVSRQKWAPEDELRLEDSKGNRWTG